jgi:hypothetical protein
MLITMDGKDSLKRILHQNAPFVTVPESGGDLEVMLELFCESKDSQKVSGNYYIKRNKSTAGQKQCWKRCCHPAQT